MNNNFEEHTVKPIEISEENGNANAFDHTSFAAISNENQSNESKSSVQSSPSEKIQISTEKPSFTQMPQLPQSLQVPTKEHYEELEKVIRADLENSGFREAAERKLRESFKEEEEQKLREPPINELEDAQNAETSKRLMEETELKVRLETERHLKEETERRIREEYEKKNSNITNQSQTQSSTSASLFSMFRKK